jgi:hypothetical protein
VGKNDQSKLTEACTCERLGNRTQNTETSRGAIARFDQVTGVTAAERELAFANIKKAAKHYKVDVTESKPEDLGTRPRTGRTA